MIAGNQILESEYFSITCSCNGREDGRYYIYLDKGPTEYGRPGDSLICSATVNLEIYYSTRSSFVFDPRIVEYVVLYRKFVARTP